MHLVLVECWLLRWYDPSWLTCVIGNSFWKWVPEQDINSMSWTCRITVSWPWGSNTHLLGVTGTNALQLCGTTPSPSLFNLVIDPPLIGATHVTSHRSVEARIGSAGPPAYGLSPMWLQWFLHLTFVCKLLQVCKEMSCIIKTCIWNWFIHNGLYCIAVVDIIIDMYKMSVGNKVAAEVQPIRQYYWAERSVWSHIRLLWNTFQLLDVNCARQSFARVRLICNIIHKQYHNRVKTFTALFRNHTSPASGPSTREMFKETGFFYLLKTFKKNIINQYF